MEIGPKSLQEFINDRKENVDLWEISKEYLEIFTTSLKLKTDKQNGGDRLTSTTFIDYFLLESQNSDFQFLKGHNNQPNEKLRLLPSKSKVTEL